MAGTGGEAATNSLKAGFVRFFSFCVFRVNLRIHRFNNSTKYSATQKRELDLWRRALSVCGRAESFVAVCSRTFFYFWTFLQVSVLCCFVQGAEKKVFRTQEWKIPSANWVQHVASSSIWVCYLNRTTWLMLSYVTHVGYFHSRAVWVLFTIFHCVPTTREPHRCFSLLFLES